MFNPNIKIMKNNLTILAIVILGTIMIAFTQSRVITGKVTDDGGQPLAGVSITVKGNKKGTITDSNGNYKITLEQQDKILIFSFAGYTTLQENVGGRSVVNVKLSKEVVALDEMVVTGYGTKKEMASKAVSMAAPSGHEYYSRPVVNRFNRDFNTEGYASVNENGFKNVKNNPLSTFSIDVDNASYSNIRQVHQFRYLASSGCRKD